MHYNGRNSCPVLLLNSLPLFPLVEKELSLSPETADFQGIEFTDIQQTIESGLSNEKQHLVILVSTSHRKTKKEFHYRNFKEDKFAKIGLLVGLHRDQNSPQKITLKGLERVSVSNFRKINLRKKENRELLSSKSKSVVWEVDYQLVNDLPIQQDQRSVDFSLHLSMLPFQIDGRSEDFEKKFKELKNLGVSDLNLLIYSNILSLSENFELTIARDFRQSVLEEVSLIARIALTKKFIDQKEAAKKDLFESVADKDSKNRTISNLLAVRAEIEQRLHDLGIDGSSGRENSENLIDKFLKDPSLPSQIRTSVSSLYDKHRRTYPEGYGQFSTEANISLQHIEQICKTPWYQTSQESTDLKKAREDLDRNHYGLQKVKDLIIEHLAVIKRIGHQPVVNKNISSSEVICLVGAPGIGKTSLISSIADSLNRKFVRINLAGVSDEAEIRGHRRTYVASYPGRIVKALQEAGTVNPIILLDEIDKISTNSLRGDVANALLEVLDPSQNFAFSDNYLGGDFKCDLRQVLFVCTANSLDTVSQPLRDRLRIISLGIYTLFEKIKIASNYLIPNNFSLYKMTADDLMLTDGLLKRIISDYCGYEGGVRNLDGSLKKIFRKVILQKENGSLATGKKAIITFDNLKSYLGKVSIDPSYVKVREDTVGRVNGLSYSSYGGSVLAVEASFSPGKGKIKITGQLGQTITESSQVALNYVRSHLSWMLPTNFFQQHDFHIHFPGSGGKDGPSAGVTITTALISAIYQLKVPSDIAMTGEINLYGGVMPIGGLREKLTSASIAGIRRAFCPKWNHRDLEEIPQEVYRENDPTSPLQLFFVDNYQEILAYLFPALHRKLVAYQQRLINRSKNWLI